MEVVPPGRTGDVFSLGPVMCHDRSKCMAMLDLMSIKSWDPINARNHETQSSRYEDDDSCASDLVIEKQIGHEIIRSRDNVNPTHVCYLVVAQVD